MPQNQHQFTMTAPKILSFLKLLLSSTMLTLLLPSIVLINKLHPAQSHPISQIIQDSSTATISSISTRVLRYSYHGSQSEIKSQTLEEAAEKALNELYHPATFDCDCDDAFETKRGRASPTIYDVSCISIKSVCHNRVCAVVKWDALFNSSLQPREERVCVSIHAGSGTCPELSGRDFCFEFDYEGSNVSRCRAAVGTEECRSCEMCGVSEGTNGGGGMQFLAPDCSNVEGMESKKFTCEDIQTVDDFNNIAFQCPRKKEEKKIKSTDPTAATTTTTKATVSPQKVKTVGRKPSSASKSSKSSSSKSTKTSKSAKSGSKRG